MQDMLAAMQEAEQVSLIRGAEKGCYLVTEMGGHKGDYTIWK